MVSASVIKYVRSLQQKKIRMKEGYFVAEGDKIVAELITSGWIIRDIFATEQWLKEYEIPKDIPIARVTPAELERMSSLSTPNKALAVVKMPEQQAVVKDVKEQFTLYCDNLQDPGNLGTIIRTADWFGINHMVCSPESADVYNPKVVQASMGSFLRVRVSYLTPRHFFDQLPPGFPVFGAVMDGCSIFSVPSPTEGVIVTGNESRGISDETAKFVTHRITIPRKRNNHFPESLNAAIATSIIMATLCR